MSDVNITDVFERLLELHGASYSPHSRLLDDFGLDSQDLLGMVLEFERILDRELDDGTILMFAQSPLNEIAARLGRLAAGNGTE